MPYETLYYINLFEGPPQEDDIRLTVSMYNDSNGESIIELSNQLNFGGFWDWDTDQGEIDIPISKLPELISHLEAIYNNARN